jgi:hypothetical protein
MRTCDATIFDRLEEREFALLASVCPSIYATLTYKAMWKTDQGTAPMTLHGFQIMSHQGVAIVFGSVWNHELLTSNL